MTRLWTKLTAVAVVALGQTVALAAPAAEGVEAAHGEPSLIAPTWAGVVPAILTLVIFLLLLVVLTKYAWGPIASGLKAREDKIRKDIADAEAARQRAEATLREYEQKLASAQDQIRQLMQQATAEAEKAAEQIRYRGRVEAEEIKEKANREIEQSRDEAIREIYAQAAELSTGIAEKIIRRNLNPEDQRDLVNESLNRLQAVR